MARNKDFGWKDKNIKDWNYKIRSNTFKEDKKNESEKQNKVKLKVNGRKND